MSEYVNLKTHPFLSGILAKERAEGQAESFKKGVRHGSTALLESLLRQKFGSLPGWAKQQLESATESQTKLWSRKVLTASTLEDVITSRKVSISN